MSPEEPTRPRALGRGLSALIGDESVPTRGEQLARSNDAAPRAGQRNLPVAFLKPGKFQPRKRFAEEDLRDLAESVREKGILQPILVRPLKGQANAYEIVAGERRWRAAQIAKLHEVPVVVREMADVEALELAIIENVQRADLNPLEEARGYHALAEEFKRGTEEIAKIVGKSRSHVANTMRLTKLPEAVQALITSGDLSAGHARALIGVADPVAAARRIVDEGLNVRQAEQLAHEQGVPTRKTAGKKAAAVKDADTVALEKRLSDTLGLAVTVDHRERGGTVHVRYRDLDQLDEIVRRLETRI